MSGRLSIKWEEEREAKTNEGAGSLIELAGEGASPKRKRVNNWDLLLISLSFEASIVMSVLRITIVCLCFRPGSLAPW